jgi:hypothetical protein
MTGRRPWFDEYLLSGFLELRTLGMMGVDKMGRAFADITKVMTVWEV